MRTHTNKWTEEEFSTVLALYAQRKTLKEIADVVGRSPSSISAKLVRMSCAKPSGRKGPAKKVKPEVEQRWEALMKKKSFGDMDIKRGKAAPVTYQGSDAGFKSSADFV